VVFIGDDVTDKINGTQSADKANTTNGRSDDDDTFILSIHHCWWSTIGRIGNETDFFLVVTSTDTEAKKENEQKGKQRSI